MRPVREWAQRLAFPLAILGYFFLWPWYRDGDPTRLLIFLKVYAAGGMLTVLAFEIICHNQRSNRVPQQTDSWSWFWLTVFKIFALWPWVIIMGIIFWLIMVGQRRQNRMPARETPPEDVS